MQTSNPSNNLHVIFGTGAVGQSIMRELLQRGKQVRMVSRSGSADVPDTVDVLAADAYSLDAARKACEGAAVVYQCAQPAYNKWVDEFPPLQANIMEAAAAQNARFVAADNLYMYGDVNGPVHEDLPYAATTRKGKVRGEMAKHVLEAYRNGKLCGALVRGSDYYGPTALTSSLGERTFYLMLEGKPAEAMGNPDLPHTYTYIDDFGKAMAIIGEHESAMGQAWHVPNAPTVSTREMLQIAFDYLGQEPKIRTVSKWMMRMVGPFMPEAGELIEMFYEFNKPFVVDSSKFVEAFGDHSTPIEEGIRATVDWYRANPHH